ncbi:MAG: polyprenyl diphosphate synthase [Steroidobacteraceae bacterium]
MHVAIIMDGNGRWAAHRGLPRTAGHAEGAKAVCAVVDAAARAGVDTLTLYAFSAANWARPPAEVDALMRLFRRYLITETHRCVERLIRINVIGRRDRLSEGLLRAIEQSERLSAGGSRMHLRIVLDYSSHDSIVQAAWRADRSAKLTPEDFRRLLDEVDHSVPPASAVDLLIRTGGEKRLSDFMLWEVAYAELHFTDCLWPDFDEQRFRCALDDYASRQRRFGALTSETP